MSATYLDNQRCLDPNLELNSSTAWNKVNHRERNLRSTINQWLTIMSHPHRVKRGLERAGTRSISIEVVVSHYSQTTNTGIHLSSKVVAWNNAITIREVHQLATLITQLEV